MFTLSVDLKNDSVFFLAQLSSGGEQILFLFTPKGKSSNSNSFAFFFNGSFPQVWNDRLTFNTQSDRENTMHQWVRMSASNINHVECGKQGGTRNTLRSHYNEVQQERGPEALKVFWVLAECSVGTVYYSVFSVSIQRGTKREKFERVSVHTGLPMSHHRAAGKERDVRRRGWRRNRWIRDLISRFPSLSVAGWRRRAFKSGGPEQRRRPAKQMKRSRINRKHFGLLAPLCFAAVLTLLLLFWAHFWVVFRWVTCRTEEK